VCDVCVVQYLTLLCSLQTNIIVVLRHKTNMNTLREMLPVDMFQYCQEHELLDALLVDSAPVVTHEATAASSDFTT
jgi:hypothetical protein